MSELRFDGRVAVVTGAGRGLGRSYALLLASKGARIIVNDLGGSLRGDGPDASPAEAVVAEIKAAGGEAAACTDSVATFDGGTKIVQSALDHFGRLDILIHNAGNVRYGTLDELSYEDFKAVVDVHLMGAFHVVRPAFPIMAKANYGRVVLTSSISGLYGSASSVNYGVSKAGMIGLNNVVALSGADKNVKSNIILPGAVTRMAEGLDVSQYPPMEPELVAPVVGYLSHESCAITGEMLISMAGRVARALIAETPGVFRPLWSIEDVAGNLDGIRNTKTLWTFPPVPSGFADHMQHSFDMARKGK
jgi:NAD(P)-dependent dehydrogenase (short-subunit alcohol dehydrogenase family)